MKDAELLREFIELTIQERLRPGFDFRAFKRMKSLPEAQKYALTTLDEIGLGSSRAAYVLSSRFALKIAQTRRGVAQNEGEFRSSQNPALEGLVITCSSHHPKFWWIVTELVKPLTSESEFEQLAGISLEDLKEDLETGRPRQYFSARVLKAVQATGLVPFDVVRLENWGKTASGRPVLLDVGFTQDVKATAYG